jgi:hypothetical protein
MVFGGKRDNFSIARDSLQLIEEKLSDNCLFFRKNYLRGSHLL